MSSPKVGSLGPFSKLCLPRPQKVSVFCPPAVSMKSPIFGPQEVQSVEGGSASITCYYPDTSVNRHSRKYWCRQGAKGRCTTLISSEGYVSEEYRGRANLTNFPESNTFVVDIGHLTQSDIGHYKCGLGISSRGLSFDVSLEVRLGKDTGPLGSRGKVRGVKAGLEEEFPERKGCPGTGWGRRSPPLSGGKDFS